MKNSEKYEKPFKVKSTILKQILMDVDITCCDLEDSILFLKKENNKLRKENKRLKSNLKKMETT